MLLFYVDECGEHSMKTEAGDDGTLHLKPGTSPYFVLAAVGVRDSSRRPLAEALHEIKTKHFGDDIDEVPWADSEIKGRFLTRAARSVAAGKVLLSPRRYQQVNSIAKANSLILDLGLVFSKYRPLIFATVVDKVDMLKRHKDLNPLGAAYAYLSQRVALTIDRLYAGESAVFIADEQNDHERFFASGKMVETREILDKGLHMKPNYKLTIDKPLWIDTAQSSWDREIIQLPDIVAYSVNEAMKIGKEPEHLSFLWPQIKSSMAQHWTRGGVESSGLSIYPRTNAYPTKAKNNRH
ncbi:DUF3800 domain-containing protein [Cnuibacter physcomitrellae]|uniref:DUF3800 domain-containing protein n=1 Tax=Cnuibacter physcomitrellae TaxID=1619308 RepID=UPI0021757427|nr:DUF3800 domain-containing protein [Cnuibacter physcomitrellae]MCS5496348.1 DUF3800 domain-containing protein [Cnuibacter physcomitrellae]